MTLQKREIERHTTGIGSSSFITPAIIMGMEQTIVTRQASMTLKNKVIGARSLDMVFSVL
ncbi:hypothetical protein QNH14_20595 [Apirhabdus apintestini]|nr:hypothetical protein QNH14_20595 [Enterobacteriaceae bacterium CA-0114]